MSYSEECPVCGRLVSRPGLCDSCLYASSGTGDSYLGKHICQICHGSGRIIGRYGETEECPYCNGAGTTDS